MSTTATIKASLRPHLPSKASIDPRVIVDDVFCLIEQNETLFRLYRDSWGHSASNGLISKIIKEHYALHNLVDCKRRNVRISSPISSLIHSHQVFTL